MKIGSLFREFVPPAIYKVARLLKKKLYNSVIAETISPRPWSRGYREYKIKKIDSILNHQMQNKEKTFLTERYCIGMDERCVEYPWLFASFPGEAKRILDAGSVLNNKMALPYAQAGNTELHILTLAPEGQAYWKDGISYIYADLRDIPIKDEFYDSIVCLSTLEHVGMDNTNFIKDKKYNQNRPKDFIYVMKELNRVLKPGGVLYISVPFGAYKHYGSFQQFDSALLAEAIEAFGDSNMVSRTFFRYTKNGWHEESEQNCASCNYVEWTAEAFSLGKFPDRIPVEEDMAAAARAVACVKIIK